MTEQLFQMTKGKRSFRQQRKLAVSASETHGLSVVAVKSVSCPFSSACYCISTHGALQKGITKELEFLEDK